MYFIISGTNLSYTMDKIKKDRKRLMINSPPDSEGVAQPKGWMNNEFFF